MDIGVNDVKNQINDLLNDIKNSLNENDCDNINDQIEKIDNYFDKVSEVALNSENVYNKIVDNIVDVTNCVSLKTDEKTSAFSKMKDKLNYLNNGGDLSAQLDKLQDFKDNFDNADDKCDYFDNHFDDSVANVIDEAIDAINQAQNAIDNAVESARQLIKNISTTTSALNCMGNILSGEVGDGLGDLIAKSNDKYGSIVNDVKSKLDQGINHADILNEKMEEFKNDANIDGILSNL